ncbi:response regulator [Sporosalibacterium faouarense]|uniref:response regulator n=1 Tax=Sporosalibacterium faouarense TaxID=516123 RepID=UPI00141C27C9|nr:response regulator [Sporosalibacterium faouarense]MTI49321.1 response regulator [Bacillota bacterium]
MINVLIVEDDPMVSELNKKYVESVRGFKVIGIARTGKDALDFLKSKNIDLVILDVYMPKMDGLRLLKEMRRSYILTDVILVTAAKEVDKIDSALKLGAVDYLIKPFQFERLKDALENYLDRQEVLQKQNDIQQRDIDRITMGDQNKRDNRLQKGLHRKTLVRIKSFMQKRKGDYLTSDEVANKLGLSKVTVRKYLEYLESIGEVKLEVEYGSVGRPSHLYKYLN